MQHIVILLYYIQYRTHNRVNAIETSCAWSPGIADSSGFEFFYTNTEPVHRAGLMSVGYNVTSRMIIPPRTDNFIVEGSCSGTCTESVRYH